jgi:neutral ceramidase
MYRMGDQEVEAVRRVFESGHLFRYRGGEGGKTGMSQATIIGVLCALCIAVVPRAVTAEADRPVSPAASMRPPSESFGDWKVGLAQASITPEEPTPLAGYAHRRSPHESVTTDLFVKAMAIEDAAGQRALVITGDILGFTGEVSEAICGRIAEQTGISRESILLNGSHTHYAPVASPHVAHLYDESSKSAILRYVERLKSKTLEAAVEALSSMEPARLSWGTGFAPFVANRREFTDAGVKLGFNPRGLVDRSVPVLRVDDSEGPLRAVFFSAAAHNVTIDNNSLSIDAGYAGYAQAYIEREHPGVQAMFMTGCAGDANTYPCGTTELARQHGATLGAEVCRVLNDRLSPVRGPLRIAFERVDLPLQEFGSRSEVEKVLDNKAPHKPQKFFVQHALELLDEGKPLPTHYNAPFTLWQFGDDLTLVGLSGETVVDYVPMVERSLGPLQLWVAGYCNDLFGYLPSARVLDEGGYETRGLYVGVGLFEPETQDVVIDTVERLAREVGRRADQGEWSP